MFGSTKRPGMRGTNTLNLGSLGAVDASALSFSPRTGFQIDTSAAPAPVQIPPDAGPFHYVKVAAGVAIVGGIAFFLWKRKKGQ